MTCVGDIMSALWVFSALGGFVVVQCMDALAVRHQCTGGHHYRCMWNTPQCTDNKPPPTNHDISPMHL